MDELISRWKLYLQGVENWQNLVIDISPRQTGCGPLYDLQNPFKLATESIAIADMRNIKFAQPHYHANGETEIYFVLQGEALIIVGGKEVLVEKDSVVVTPPSIAHFTVVHKDLVLAVVNTPPFNPENNIDLTQSNQEVKFDLEQFKRLTKEK